MKKIILVYALFTIINTTLCGQSNCYIVVDYSSCHNCINSLYKYSKLSEYVETDFIFTEFYRNYKDSFFIKNIVDKIEKNQIIYSDSMFEKYNLNMQTELYLFNDKKLLLSSPLCGINDSELIHLVRLLTFNNVEFRSIDFPSEINCSEYVKLYLDGNDIYITNEFDGSIACIRLDSVVKGYYIYKVDSSIIYKVFNQSNFKKYFTSFANYLIHQRDVLNKSVMFKTNYKFTSVFVDNDFVYLLLDVLVIVPEKNKIIKHYYICKFNKRRQSLVSINEIKKSRLYDVDTENAFYAKGDVLYMSVMHNKKDSKTHLAKYKVLNGRYIKTGNVKYPKPVFCDNYNFSFKVLDNNYIHFVSVPSFYNIKENREVYLPYLSKISECKTINEYLTNKCKKIFISSTYNIGNFFSVLYFYDNNYYLSYFSNKNYKLLKSYVIPAKEKKYGSRGLLLNENEFLILNFNNNKIEIYKLN